MKFTLVEFIEGAIDRFVMKSNGKGGYTNARVTFMPGEIYETEDDVLAKYIKGEIGDVRQKSVVTPDLMNDIKTHGIEYELHKCGTCASAKPKVFYNPFKIVEE